MSETIGDKVAKLPTWARQHIKQLETLAAPNLSELTELRKKLAEADNYHRRMRDRYLTVLELVQAAAVGGHQMAKAYVERVISEYSPDDAVDVLTGPLWLVWSNEHAAGWGPNRAKYYWDIAAAGRYTLEEALDICKARGVKRGEGINPPELIQPAPEWFEQRTEIIERGKVNGLVETS